MRKVNLVKRQEKEARDVLDRVILLILHLFGSRYGLDL
jgi:hypothetical protein